MKYLNKRNLLLLSVGTISFVFFLLAQLPASFGWQYAPPQIKKQIQLTGLQGSVWNGSAATSFINGQDTGRLRWEISPSSFLFGKLGITFNLAGKSGTIGGELQLNNTRVSAQNINSSLRASFFNAILARQLPLPLMLQGKINAELKTIEFERGKQLQLVGNVDWKNAEVQGVQNFPLGKVSILLQKTDTGSIIRISNKNNPLDIKGTITLSHKGQYDIRIGLLNRDPARKDLNDMLSFLGQPDTDGRYYYKQKGMLRL